MAQVMLLLGGNIGDVESRINSSVELLERCVGRVVARSGVECSEAWGFSRETPSFLNEAVQMETELSPEELLTQVQRVEQLAGREREREMEEKIIRGERYASRRIDIDIILYDELIYESERLTIPHPLMAEREFVLHPISQIAPEWRNARLGRSCRELLMEITKES